MLEQEVHGNCWSMWLFIYPSLIEIKIFPQKTLAGHLRIDIEFERAFIMLDPWGVAQ